MNRCAGITVSGRQCRRSAVSGSEYCAQHVDNPCRADFDALVERAVNGLAVVATAESSGRWTPTAKTNLLLNTLHDVLLERRKAK